MLLVLGNSDNLNTGETGQFGMGFASYTTLSTTVLLQTKYRTKDGKGADYAMLGRDGVSFKQVKMPALENYGTKLTLQLHNDISLGDLHEMMEMAKTASALQDVDCRVGIDNDVDQIERITLESMVKAAAGGGVNDDVYSGCINDIQYSVAFTKYQNSSQKLFLGGAPITIESELEMCGAMGYFNVLDEGRYKPMPERERFTKDAEDKIKTVVEDTIMKKIIAQADLPTDLSDIVNYEHKALINRMSYSDRLEKYAPVLYEVIQTYNRTQIEYTSNTNSHKPQNKNMVDFFLNTTGVFVKSKIFYTRHRKVIEEYAAGDDIWYIKDNGTLPAFIRSQIPDIADYIKEHELQPKKAEAVPTQAILHSNLDGTYNTTTYENRDKSKTIVMTKQGDIMEVIKKLKQAKSKYYFVKNYHVFDEFAISWDEYISTVTEERYTFGGISGEAQHIIRSEYTFFKLPPYYDELSDSLKQAMSDRDYFEIKNTFDFENAFDDLNILTFNENNFIQNLTDSDLRDRNFVEYMFAASTPLEKKFVEAVSRNHYRYDNNVSQNITFPKDITGFELEDWNLKELARLCDKYKNRSHHVDDFEVRGLTGEYFSSGIKELFREYLHKNNTEQVMNYLLTGSNDGWIRVIDGDVEIALPEGKTFEIEPEIKLLAGDMDIISIKAEEGKNVKIKIKCARDFS